MEKNKLTFITCLLLITGCGKVNVVMKQHTTFTKNSTITIVVENDDKVGVQGKLEHLLLERGFEVLSEAVTLEKVKLQSESENGLAVKSKEVSGESAAAIIGKSRSEKSLSRVTEVKSSYILRFRYNAYEAHMMYSMIIYWAFTTFNATVVNLDSGEVVASVNFSGDRSVDSVLEEFANKLASMAKSEN